MLVIQKCYRFILILIAVLTIAPVIAQNDTIKSDLSFDFGITRGRNIDLWPIFKRFKNADEKELQILFPIFSQHITYKPVTRHFRLLPVFIGDSSSSEVDRRFLSLYYPTLYHYNKLVQNDTLITSHKFLELAPNISCVGISRSPKGIFLENNLLFFLWYKRDDILNKTHLVVFPTYWYFSNRRDTTQLLLPLYYYRKSANDAHHLNVGLIFDQQKKPELSRTVLFPLIWKSNFYGLKDTTNKFTLFPIYWSTTDKIVHNRVVFPVYYQFKDAYYQSLTIFPFYSAGNSPNLGRKHLDIVPFYWYYREPGFERTVWFPLWWQTRNYSIYDTTIHKTLFPVYWSIITNSDKSRYFFPLVYSFKNQSGKLFLVFPLFYNSKAADASEGITAITPLFWHTHTKKLRRDVVFPLFWHKETYRNSDTIYRNTLFPVYWATRSHFKNNKILFPLIFSLKDVDYQSFTLLPIFSTGHNADHTEHHTEWLQLYWHIETSQSNTHVVFPLWWKYQQYRTSDTLTRKILFPVYFSSNSPQKHNRIYFPVFYQFSNQSRTSFTVFPFYSQGYHFNEPRSYFAITPFYWHLERRSATRDFLFPIYWAGRKITYNDTIFRHTLFPLYWSKVSNKVNNKILFPFYYNLHNQYSRSLTLLPLFSTGGSVDGTRRYTEILQLYWHNKNSTNNNTVLFPVIWSLKGKNHNNMVVFSLLFSLKNNYRKSFTLFPLITKGSAIDSSWNYVGATPLFWHLKDISRKQDVLFPVFWQKEEYHFNDTTYRTTVFPVYCATRNKNKNDKILFPLVWSLQNKNYQSFTLFPLFSYGKNNQKNRKHVLVTPLFGYFKKPGQTREYLFPIYTFNEENKTRTSSLFFFLYRHKQEPGVSKTSILWPIVDRVNSESLKTFRIAPIIWYKKTPDSRMISVQPFQYAYRDNDRSTFLLFWILYKHQVLTDSVTSNSILWRLYNHDRYNNGDFETRFLYLVYANIQLQGKTEKSLFPFYHRVNYQNGDESKSVALAFYNYFRQYKPEINDYYEEQRIFWLIRFRSNYEKLKSEGKGNFTKRR